MPWVWSDELASVAEAAGISAEETVAWRARPMAFSEPGDGDLVRLVRSLLGLPAAAEAHPEAISDAEAKAPACRCGRP
jgi:hypothetical protein